MSLLRQGSAYLVIGALQLLLDWAVFVLATAAGAYMRIEGGGIQRHAPGKGELKAGVHNWVGPQSGAGPAQPPQGDMEGCAAALEDAAGRGALAA
ncbi:hypothetical protein G6F58_013555 [Rhizopus delemar]|nr:hypothetical protein G6F58_013555 [Rhizopus delemar]